MSMVKNSNVKNVKTNVAANVENVNGDESFCGYSECYESERE